MAYVPGLTQTTIPVPDALQAGGNILTAPVTIAQRAATVDADYVVGRLCYPDSLGKLHLLDTAATVETIQAAAGDIIIDDVGATPALIQDATLARPPVPGTVTIVSTTNGSATPVFSIGPDNGDGFAESADGFFEIDYDSGRVRIVFAVALTANDDLKAAYDYRITDALAANEAHRGLPRYILTEDVLGASVVAGDVKTVAIVKGRVRQQSLIGYQAGYEGWLRKLGIHIQA